MQVSAGLAMKVEKLKKVVDDSACFVCGPDNQHGIKAKIQTDKENMSSYTCLTLDEHFQGWQDVIHGGILATLLDEACAYACMSVAEHCVTAEIKVRYRKPVNVGQKIEVFGRVVDKNRNVWLATAEIKIAGKIHAQAEAKMFILTPS